MPARPSSRRRSTASLTGRRAGRRPPRGGPPGGRAACCPATLAFRLHDTYGFPIDLTVELAAEYGVGVDRAGFDAALAEQRERSRSGKKAELAKHAELTSLYQAIQARRGDTAFLGYETTTAPGDGRRDHPRRHGVRRADRPAAPPRSSSTGRRSTPRAAARSATSGELREAGGGSSLFAVEDTQKPVGGLIVQRGHAPRPAARRRDRGRRRRSRAARPHDAQPHGTHLLHRALRNVVGEAGPPGRLARHARLPALRLPVRPGADRRRDSGRSRTRSGAVIRDDRPVTPSFMTMQEAIDAGADAFFDEKYGETVRTVRVEGYQPRAVRRHPLPRIGPDRQLRDHRRAEHRLRDAPDRGADRAPARTRTCGRAADALARPRPRRPAPRPSTSLRRPDPGAPGRAARDEAPAQGGRRRGGGLPTPAELAAGRTRSRRASGSSPSPGPYDSIDALKAAAKDLRGVLAVGRHRARPRRRRAAAVRHRQRRPRRARDRRRRPRPRGGRRRSTARAAAGPRWPRARAPGATAWRRPWPRVADAIRCAARRRRPVTADRRLRIGGWAAPARRDRRARSGSWPCVPWRAARRADPWATQPYSLVELLRMLRRARRGRRARWPVPLASSRAAARIAPGRRSASGPVLGARRRTVAGSRPAAGRRSSRRVLALVGDAPDRRVVHRRRCHPPPRRSAAAPGSAGRPSLGGIGADPERVAAAVGLRRRRSG